MFVSIGILAWNEASEIDAVIRSLFTQTLLKKPCDPSIRVEVVCVPNGCTDNTAQVARQTFEACLAETLGSHIACKVFEISEAGKCNAWNRYVHDFASPDAEFMFLMDADIWFDDPGTFETMLKGLIADPHAQVAVDAPIKHIENKKQKSLLDWLSLMFTDSSKNGPPMICGQLYCGRAQTLRSIWMPRGITIDDGFLTKLIWTNQLRTSNDFSRIIRVPNASHVFGAYTSLRDVFLHQRSLAVGSALNSFVYDYLKKQIPHEGAGMRIRELNNDDPAWLEKLVCEKLVYRRDLFRMRWCRSPRYRHYSRQKGLFRLKGLPAVLVGIIMDNLVNLAAWRLISQQADVHTWQKIRSDQSKHD